MKTYSALCLLARIFHYFLDTLPDIFNECIGDFSGMSLGYTQMKAMGKKYNVQNGL